MFELFDGVEFLFVPEFFKEEEVEGLAVEVTGEVEDVGFDGDVAGGVDSGTGANVDRGFENGVVGESDLAGVDTIGAEGWGGEMDVGGGPSELGAEAFALGDGSSDGVGASEHDVGVLEVAGGEGLANAATADDFCLVVGGRGDGEVKVLLLGPMAEHGNGSLAPVAEVPVGTDGEGFECGESFLEGEEEVLGALAGAFEIEGQDDG